MTVSTDDCWLRYVAALDHERRLGGRAPAMCSSMGAP